MEQGVGILEAVAATLGAAGVSSGAAPAAARRASALLCALICGDLEGVDVAAGGACDTQSFAKETISRAERARLQQLAFGCGALPAGSTLQCHVLALRGFALQVLVSEHRVPLAPAHACALDGPLGLELTLTSRDAGLGSAAVTLAAVWSPAWRHTAAGLGFGLLASVEVALESEGETLASSSIAPGAQVLPGGGCAGRQAVGLQVSAALPPASTCYARVRTVQAVSLAADGHTLCVRLPTRLGQSRTQSVAVRAWFLDRELGGVRGAVSPTHAFTATRWPAEPRAAVFTLAERGGEEEEATLLVEPGNAAVTWHTLRPTAGQGSLPCGLADWLSLCSMPPGRADAEAALPGVAPAATPLVPSEALPRHIAVVMDGNGRWAQARGLPRSAGHRAGVDAIHTLIRGCRRLRIPYLTLFAFSAQNWARPPAEVATLMALLQEFVSTDLEELTENGVRLRMIGDVSRLPHSARTGLERMIERSAGNKGLTLILALSYGGREEIAAAASAAASAAVAGRVSPASLSDPVAFRAFLPLPDVPDPDLLIRTSGEMRVSNFLLWHIAYTELHVTAALWPDFDEAELAKACAAYAGRERRFGLTKEQLLAKGKAAAPLLPADASTNAAAASQRPRPVLLVLTALLVSALLALLVLSSAATIVSLGGDLHGEGPLAAWDCGWNASSPCAAAVRSLTSSASLRPTVGAPTAAGPPSSGVSPLGNPVGSPLRTPLAQPWVSIGNLARAGEGWASRKLLACDA
jgi:undecaprenyl diphosphate synthase